MKFIVSSEYHQHPLIKEPPLTLLHKLKLSYLVNLRFSKSDHIIRSSLESIDFALVVDEGLHNTSFGSWRKNARTIQRWVEFAAILKQSNNEVDNCTNLFLWLFKYYFSQDFKLLICLEKYL